MKAAVEMPTGRQLVHPQFNLEETEASMPSRSGSRFGWSKVKCPIWREANRERSRLFEKRWSRRESTA